MITVAYLREPYEAHLANGLLESHGGPAGVIDDHIVWMNSLYSCAVGWVKVKVPPEFLDQARELLAQDFTTNLAQIPESSLPYAPGDKCPHCGSDLVSLNRTRSGGSSPVCSFGHQSSSDLEITHVTVAVIHGKRGILQAGEVSSKF